MTLKPSKTDAGISAGSVALLTTALAGRAGAAGRTYKSQNEDNNPKLSCAVCAVPNMWMVALTAFTSGKAAAKMR